MMDVTFVLIWKTRHGYGFFFPLKRLFDCSTSFCINLRKLDTDSAFLCLWNDWLTVVQVVAIFKHYNFVNSDVWNWVGIRPRTLSSAHATRSKLEKQTRETFDFADCLIPHRRRPRIRASLPCVNNGAGADYPGTDVVLRGLRRLKIPFRNSRASGWRQNWRWKARKVLPTVEKCTWKTLRELRHAENASAPDWTRRDDLACFCNFAQNLSIWQWHVYTDSGWWLHFPPFFPCFFSSPYRGVQPPAAVQPRVRRWCTRHHRPPTLNLFARRNRAGKLGWHTLAFQDEWWCRFILVILIG